MQQVADKLGISQQAVSQAVNGNPSLSRLKDIADAIGVTVSELVSDGEPHSTHTATCPHCGHEIEITIELK
jgi:transcriptional regulator with XRE-family HTH domain